MTEQKVGSFLAELAQAQRAMERVPVLETELERRDEQIEAYAKQVQSLEMRAIDRKNEIDALQAKLRDAEVARDDVELRFLELDEKTSKLYSKSLTVQTFLNELVEGLNDTMPKPIADTTPGAEPGPGAETGRVTSEHSPVAEQSQSESHPTSSVGESDHPMQVDDPSLPYGPYSGKLYINHPVWVSREDWIAGGGTEENYDYRENTFARSGS